jgi:DNA-binding NarL/FixJ family response regulator
VRWATPLFGRSAELAELEHERRRSAAGEFRSVLLLADPGIGKTRLARELVGRHRARATSLSARAYPLGGTAAFGVWSEALEGHLNHLDARQVSELCGGFFDDLAGLVRSIAAARGGAPTREPPRMRVLEGLALVLAKLARKKPVIVFLDDAHVADASSWETLDYLARNLPGERVLVVAAARPGELAENEAATRVHLTLEQEGLLRRLPLPPLAADALGGLAKAVLEAAPPAPLVEWLDRRSQGNPLFALGLLQALVDEGADLADPGLRSLPEELAERVAHRVSGLEEAELITLQALAVAESRVELPDLVSFSGLTVQRLGVVLERLAALRLVAEDEQRGRLTYEVAHPLIQQAIYERIGAARRRGVHRQIGRVLLAAGRLAEAAPHFARSAAIGDQEAIDALRDAVAQAESLQAYREALTVLGALVELIPRSDRRWLEVLDAISGQAEWVVDHRADTHALLGIEAMRAIDGLLDPSWDPAPRAIVKFRLAHFLGWGTGELEDAAVTCAEARSLFERAGDRAAVLLTDNELAWIRGLQGDYAAMEVGGRRVAEAGEAIGDRFASIQGFHTAGHAAWIRGRLAEGESALRKSNAIAREDGKVYRETVGSISLATCLALQGRIEEALPLLDEAKEANPGWRDSILPEWESIVHWFAGDYATAVARSQEAEARSPGLLSRRRVIGVVFAALAAVEAGETALARKNLSRARQALGDREWQFFAAACDHVDGVLAWQAGSLAQALASIRSVPGRIEATGALPFAAVVLFDLAELATEAGDAVAAADATAELEAVASRIGLDPYRGLAAIAAGDGVAAVDLLAGCGWRGFRARVLDLIGRSPVGGDRRASVDALTAAVDAYDSCGAAWRRERAREALRALGTRGRRAAVSGLGAPALSSRELEVARLAVSGRTAKEIGEELFISERTVETHLANVYAKLGVRSKLDLVRRAAEFALNQ